MGNRRLVQSDTMRFTSRRNKNNPIQRLIRPCQIARASFERLEPRMLFASVASGSDPSITPGNFTRCPCGCGGFLWAATAAAQAAGVNDGLPRGLVTTYWANSNFTGDAIARVEPNIDLQGAPQDLLTDKSLSARWEGKIIPTVTGSYTFEAGVTGTAKLWINGQLAVDSAANGSGLSKRIDLQKGEKYDLRMDFSCETGAADAQARLLWTTEAIGPAEVVPLASLTPMVSAAITSPIRVNFQPIGQAIPSGYLQDGGQVYGDRGNGQTYGWNIDLQSASRDRNVSPDQRNDTLNHMQRFGNGVWEIAVPNGTYNVTLVAGDTNYTDSVYRTNVEGVLALNGTPTSNARFIQGSISVNVTDGKLTVSNASGASNNKINFIDIAPASTSNVAPTVTLTAPPNGATFTAGSTIALSATAQDSDGTVARVEFYQGTTKLGEDTSLPYTFGWSNVGAGNYTISARAVDDGGATTTSNTSNISVTSSSTQTPFSGSPVNIENRIEAENFDNGGEGVAYHDFDSANQGNASGYRSTSVDIQTTADTGGGYSVGFVHGDEWLEYTVNIPSAGNYTFEARVASGGTGGTFHAEFNGVDKTGLLTIPNTGGWENWQTISRTVSLSAGVQILRVFVDSNSLNIGNFNFFRIASVPVGGGLVAPAQLSADNVFSEQINLAWIDQSTNETGFKIERKTGAAGAWAQVGTTVANVTAYFDSSVASNTQYFYRARAYNASGNSGYSAETTGTTSRDLSWSTFGTSPVARMEPGATTIGSKLYILGGFITRFSLQVNNDMWRWDVATNTWTQLADFPGSQTHFALTNDGVNIYKAAGQIGTGGPGSTGDDRVWKFNTATSQWSALPSLPAIRFGGYMAYLDNTLEFFTGDDAGRVNPQPEHWRLDLANLAAGWVARAPVPLPGDHIQGAVLNGKIYLVGGEESHGVDYIQHPYMQEYDPATNLWRQRAQLPGPGDGLSHAEATTFVSDGRIVVVAGMVRDNTNSADVRVFDPTSNSWSKLAAMPQPRKGSTGILWNGRYYSVTGEQPGEISDDIFVTDWPA